MRALFLITHTADCENKWRSLACLGHQVVCTQYDAKPHDQHGEIVDLARSIGPHVIVFVGAIEKYHGRPVPTADVLCRLREVAPTVHICGDASDKPWWPYLEEYDRRECFDAQVSIDGSPDTPIARFKTGLVRLTPVDPAPFAPMNWEDRTITAAFAGGRGHGDRAALIDHLKAADQRFIWHGPTDDYREMCRFLGRCRIVVNHPMNGTGDGDHVKGRVVEAAFAGACLLERAGSPTFRWFREGREVVAYRDAEHAAAIISSLSNEEAKGVAARLRARALAEHHPRIFWRDVLARAGVKATQEQVS